MEQFKLTIFFLSPLSIFFFCATADPHAGNILFCLSTTAAASTAALDDAGSTVGNKSSIIISNAVLPSLELTSFSSSSNSLPRRLSYAISGKESSQHNSSSASTSTSIKKKETIQTPAQNSASEASNTRFVYEATPAAKGVTFNLSPASADGSAVVVGSEAATAEDASGSSHDRFIYDATPAKQSTTAAAAALSPLPPPPPPYHRMIYDATPAKSTGTGAAAASPAVEGGAEDDCSDAGGDADSSTTAVASQAFTPLAASTSSSSSFSSSSAPAPSLGSATASATPTPTPVTAAASCQLAATFSTPGATVEEYLQSKNVTDNASSSDGGGGVSGPEIIPGLLDFGMTVR